MQAVTNSAKMIRDIYYKSSIEIEFIARDILNAMCDGAIQKQLYSHVLYEVHHGIFLEYKITKEMHDIFKNDGYKLFIYRKVTREDTKEFNRKVNKEDTKEFNRKVNKEDSKENTKKEYQIFAIGEDHDYNAEYKYFISFGSEISISKREAELMLR